MNRLSKMTGPKQAMKEPIEEAAVRMYAMHTAIFGGEEVQNFVDLSEEEQAKWKQFAKNVFDHIESKVLKAYSTVIQNAKKDSADRKKRKVKKQ